MSESTKSRIVQERPTTLEVDAVIDIDASNKKQQRGTHGAFRYFGKLAPDVTGHVLDVAAEFCNPGSGPLVDLMNGSGTTVLEGVERGWSGIGIEVNPVALLYSRVKTTPVDTDILQKLVKELENSTFEPGDDDIALVFGKTRNAERWFSEEALREVTRLRLLINQFDPSAERSLLLAALLARLRRISNASRGLVGSFTRLSRQRATSLLVCKSPLLNWPSAYLP